MLSPKHHLLRFLLAMSTGMLAKDFYLLDCSLEWLGKAAFCCRQPTILLSKLCSNSLAGFSRSKHSRSQPSESCGSGTGNVGGPERRYRVQVTEHWRPWS